MHEFGIVESMIEETVRTLTKIGIERGQVKAVRFQRGSTFSEAVLRQAFEMLSAGTILENAELIIETVNLQFECACGFKQIVTSDDLVGHMFVCPVCGAIREISEAHDLTLIQVVADQEPATVATPATLAASRNYQNE